MPLDPNDAPAGYVAITNEAEDCQGCALAPIFSPACERTEGLCLSIVREDGQDVIFVKRPEAQAAPAAVAEPSERRNEAEAAWNDLPDSLRCHPGLKRLYRALMPAAAPAAAQPVAQEAVTLADVLDALNLFNRPKPSEDDGPWEGGHFIRVDYLPAFINIIAKAWFAPSPPPALVGLSDEQIVAALVESGCIGTVKMSYDSGPYEITRTSINADRFAKAVERALAAANGMTLREGGNG